MPHEKLEKAEFARLQADQLSGALDHPRQQVELEVADLQRSIRRAALAPARQRLEAGQQLTECEGLYQIIVAAGVQAGDAIIHVTERAQNQHRRAFSRRSQGLDQ